MILALACLGWSLALVAIHRNGVNVQTVARQARLIEALKQANAEQATAIDELIHAERHQDYAAVLSWLPADVDADRKYWAVH